MIWRAGAVWRLTTLPQRWHTQATLRDEATPAAARSPPETSDGRRATAAVPPSHGPGRRPSPVPPSRHGRRAAAGRGRAAGVAGNETAFARERHAKSVASTEAAGTARGGRTFGRTSAGLKREA